MANRWPSNWRKQLLEALEIEPTQYALDVLSAWRRSTPLEPWTNNPLGLDAKTANRPTALHTRYAVFPSMSAFRAEFVRLKSTASGRRVIAALDHGTTYQEAWHAIRTLNTPGKATETDYPVHLIDLASKAYEENVPKKSKGKAKTTGVVRPVAPVHEAMHNQNMALHHAAKNIQDASAGIRHIMKRMN